MVLVLEIVFGLLLGPNTKDISLGKARQITVFTRVSKRLSIKLIYSSPFCEK
ncbi:MAG: hypothetical protein AAF915_19155 [Cyanobacteria bacterium P01_D01_bin.50]